MGMIGAYRVCKQQIVALALVRKDLWRRDRFVNLVLFVGFLATSLAWAQNGPRPICDAGCGGSASNSSAMLVARTALTATRGIGSLTRPASRPRGGPVRPTPFPSPILTKSVAIQGSQSYSYSIPLLSFPGRHGLNLNLDLHYNSLIWTAAGRAITLNADHDTPSIGFRLDFGYIEWGTDSNGDSTAVLVEPDGTKHSLTASVTNSNPNLYSTTDSSYINVLWVPPSGSTSTLNIATLKSGLQITYVPEPSGSIFRPTLIEDSNGNLITINYLKNTNIAISSVTDTVGRVVNFFYDSTGTMLQCITTASNCATPNTQTYSFSWNTNYVLNFGFTQSVGAQLQSGVTTLNVLTGVQRPDKTSVTFGYGDWGIVNHVTELSASGSMRSSASYNFPTANAGILSANPSYTQQTVFDGVNQGIWNYSATLNSSGVLTAFTMTDPCGTATTTNYTSGLPTQVQVTSAQPASPATGCPQAPTRTWRTMNEKWTSDAGGNPLPGSVTTILDDNSQSEVVYNTYDANGNATDVLQYDFGAGAPGPLIKEVVTAYAALGNRIFDHPSDIQVKDGNGKVVSHQTFTYDGVVVKSVSPAASMHDETNYSASGTSVRGNMTSTTVYANPGATSGGITSNFTYDETGNLLTSNAGCCTQEQQSFSSATQYAFPDSVTAGPSGNQLTTNYTYNMSTATLASTTDPNGQITTLSYDLDNRVVGTKTPDGVTATLAYDDSSANPSMTSSNSVNGAVSKTVLDGAGRTLSLQMLNGSSPVSSVSYAYNILGEQLQASNPAGPNDALMYTTFAYDALGRVIQATPPALAGVTSQGSYETSYSGPTVTSTDPAGKTRKQYSNALGRLVQVDEPGLTGGAAGSGSVTISGTEQSASVANGGGATGATGSVTFGGADRSTQVLTHNATQASGSISIYGSENSATVDPCQDQTPPDGGPPPSCPRTVWDNGTVSLTINGTTKSVNYGINSTPNSIASALAGVFGNNGTYSVTPLGSTISVTADTTGSWGNGITLSCTSATGDTNDFGGPSFWGQTSGSTLANGSDNGYTTYYDTGTVQVSVTINNTLYSKQSNYSQNTSGGGIASDLANQINSDNTLNKLLVANPLSNVLNLTTVATGANTAYPLSASSATNSQYFSSGSSSFTASASGSTMKPGHNGTVYDAGTVTLSIAGFTTSAIQYTADYSQGSTSATVATALGGAINADPFAPVTATVVSGSDVVSLAAKIPGLDTNYSLTTVSATSQSAYFSQPSFSASATSLTGGSDPTPSLASPLSTYYTYDPMGGLLQVTQGQQTRTYVYDGLEKMTSAAVPERANAAVTFSYTDFGAISQRTDPRLVSGTSNNITATYTYDSLNRATGVSYNDGTPGVTYTYNAPNSANNTGGRLAKVTNGIASETYQYDLMGRPTQCSKVIGGNTYVIGYVYNADGTLASMTYPSGRVINQSHDGIGRLTGVGMGGTSLLNVTSYNPAGEALGLTYGNQISATYSFNNQLEIGSILYGNSSSALLNLTYNYGGAQDNGQIQGVTDNLTSSRSTTYIYDELGRLKTAQTNDLTSPNTWKLKFTYDRNGNRLTQIPIAGTAAMPLSEELVDPTTNRISGNGYLYDNAGNVVSDGLNNYAFDAENRLKSAAPIPGLPGNSATFSYDAAGLRVNKNGNIYIYSGGKPIAEYANGAVASAPSMEYVYSGGLLASIASGTTTYYYHDHLSTRVQADGAGNIARTYGHYPFGETWYETGTAGKWKFTSYEGDRGSGESGLDYAMARFYTSRQGRFLSLDPVLGATGNPQSLNRYAYVVNDPINQIDPTGRLHGRLGCLLDDHGNCVGGNGYNPGQGGWGDGELDQHDSGPVFSSTFGAWNDPTAWHPMVEGENRYLAYMYGALYEAQTGQSAAASDITIYVNCNSGYQGVGWDCRIDPNSFGYVVDPFYSVHVGDTAVGMDIWHCAGCKQLWQQSSITGNIAAGATVGVLALPVLVQAGVASVPYFQAGGAYLYYVAPSSGPGLFVWRILLNSKAGSLQAFFDLLERIQRSVEDTPDDPEWWVGLED